jgi:uncharacterized protein (DUF2236 family)
MDRAPSLGPGAVSWRLHREVALLAGWGRAILLQLAHPLVAQGVAEHSAFLREPHGHVRRLRRTLESMLALTFGSDDEARRAAARINAIHDRVHGQIAARQGAHPAGATYSAHDPDLLVWVHATLLDSFLLTFQLFVADLTESECDRYCAESSRIEPLLGIPADHLPRSHEALQRYLASMLATAFALAGCSHKQADADRLAAMLQLKPGMVVADVGAGAGDAVGDSGPREIRVAQDDLENARQLVTTDAS